VLNNNFGGLNGFSLNNLIGFYLANVDKDLIFPYGFKG